MEALVEVEELLVLPFTGRAPLLHELEPEVIELFDPDHLAGTSDPDRLERPAQVLDLPAVRGREVAHGHLPSGADLDEALLEQPAERLAHRCPRAVEALGELPLVEDAAGRRVTAENAVPKPSVDPVGEPFVRFLRVGVVHPIPMWTLACDAARRPRHTPGADRLTNGTAE